MSDTGTRSDVDVPARNLKPLSFLPALGIFLAIGIWNRVCIYSMIPFLEDRGMHQFSAYLTGFLLGLAPLLPLAFAMLSQEGNPMGWPRCQVASDFAGSEDANSPSCSV